MQAAVLYGKEDVKVESVAVPRIGPRDVLVRVKAALTCGTDVKVFRRGYHARMIQPPALFGHELAGDVVATGAEVRKFREGDRVVAANSAPCGDCYYCKRNLENLCDDLLFNNGAYAEFIRIPGRIVEKNTYKIPAHVDYQDAALAEPLACVLRGLEESNVRSGDTVVVIGLGPIGLMFVRMAKVLGARVVAMARRHEQLDDARRMGAAHLICLPEVEDPASAVRALTDGRGADVVIEAVGKPEVWDLSVRLLRKGGTVNFFGGCPNETQVGLDTNLLHYSELTCKASFHHTPRQIQQALEAVSRRHICASDFVAGQASLDSLRDVLRSLMNSSGRLKTAIIP
ncbi:MAG: zinc-binding dehydrogenase [Acidobacteria bacterium]|nr:zinc-binding dehydrogenase [Acidobacteriota bacterium]